jgi:hypothetical protein
MARIEAGRVENIRAPTANRSQRLSLRPAVYNMTGATRARNEIPNTIPAAITPHDRADFDIGDVPLPKR